jgi:hypothetical protein
LKSTALGGDGLVVALLVEVVQKPDSVTTQLQLREEPTVLDLPLMSVILIVAPSMVNGEHGELGHVAVSPVDHQAFNIEQEHVPIQLADLADLLVLEAIGNRNIAIATYHAQSMDLGEDGLVVVLLAEVVQEPGSVITHLAVMAETTVLDLLLRPVILIVAWWDIPLYRLLIFVDM